MSNDMNAKTVEASPYTDTRFMGCYKDAHEAVARMEDIKSTVYHKLSALLGAENLPDMPEEGKQPPVCASWLEQMGAEQQKILGLAHEIMTMLDVL